VLLIAFLARALRRHRAAAATKGSPREGGG
jgi:hypothetical protein